MKRLLKTATALLLLLLVALPLAAQESKQAEEQRRIIAELEKSIAKEERQLSTLKKDKASAQKRVSLLTKQIEKRNALINATSRQIKGLTAEIAQSTKRVGELSATLDALEQNCREMARAAWRNYRFNNALAYIFSADSFAETARRIATLRTATTARSEKMKEIEALRRDVESERQALDAKRATLAESKRDLDRQRQKIQNDAKTARQTVNRMSKQEQAVLKKKLAQEERLDEAIKKLRRLTKGNKTGASFSNTTANLHLPVVGGRVRRYQGNMAEITGGEGAKIISIYEGKVVEVMHNRLTNKYDVYIAHGEYITSYANLASVAVEKNQTVARDQKIGTIGSAVNLSTMAVEYKIVFGIHAPSPSIKVSAESCFKKK